MCCQKIWLAEWNLFTEAKTSFLVWQYKELSPGVHSDVIATLKTQKHFIIVLQDKIEWIFSDSFAEMWGKRRNPVVAKLMIEGML